MKIDQTSISANIDTSLWQYDKSDRLNALFSMMSSVLRAASLDFLNNFEAFVMSVNNIGNGESMSANAGLAIWGLVTGLKRPSVTISGTVTPISDDLYKRLLIARLRQMYSPGTLDAIESFISYVFGNNVYIIDNNDMTIGIVKMGTLTDEEDALLNSSVISSVIQLPIGVGFNITSSRETGQFGLNISDDSGQDLNNFALTQDSTNGGSLA